MRASKLAIVKVFVSSVIGGMEPLRAAAATAIRTLGHEPITAEAFAAGPTSPRVACLAGVRDADAVVVLLGARYGDPQPTSGLSPTHEEYREARGTRPIFGFVQEGVAREPAQGAFLNEVQNWDTGLFRAAFSTPEQLQAAVTQALHRWELSNAAAPVDVAELRARVIGLIPTGDRDHFRNAAARLYLAVAGAPSQPIIRPVEIEKPELRREMLQRALFGDSPIFTTGEASENAIEAGAIVLTQESGARMVVNEGGSVRLTLPVASAGTGLPVLIAESVADRIAGGLSYAAWVLDRIDPRQRLSRVAIATRVSASDYSAWRSRVEHAGSPNQVCVNVFGNRDRAPVHLDPIDRPRAALTHERDRIVEDLTILLARQWR